MEPETCRVYSYSYIAEEIVFRLILCTSIARSGRLYICTFSRFLRCACQLQLVRPTNSTVMALELSSVFQITKCVMETRTVTTGRTKITAVSV